MTVPTSIPETSQAQPNSESLQESKETISPRSMDVLQHVLKRYWTLRMKKRTNPFSEWMKYRGYDNFTDICADFCHILDRIHDYSEFRADGLRSVL